MQTTAKSFGRAIHDCLNSVGGSLTFSKGQQVEILNVYGDWWQVLVDDGRQGIVPANFFESFTPPALVAPPPNPKTAEVVENLSLSPSSVSESVSISAASSITTTTPLAISDSPAVTEATPSKAEGTTPIITAPAQGSLTASRAPLTEGVAIFDFQPRESDGNSAIPISQGEKVKFVFTKNGWSMIIKANNSTGYIPSDFLRFEDGESGKKDHQVVDQEKLQAEEAKKKEQEELERKKERDLIEKQQELERKVIEEKRAEEARLAAEQMELERQKKELAERQEMERKMLEEKLAEEARIAQQLELARKEKELNELRELERKQEEARIEEERKREEERRQEEARREEEQKRELERKQEEARREEEQKRELERKQEEARREEEQKLELERKQEETRREEEERKKQEDEERKKKEEQEAAEAKEASKKTEDSTKQEALKNEAPIKKAVSPQKGSKIASLSAGLSLLPGGMLMGMGPRGSANLESKEESGGGGDETEKALFSARSSASGAGILEESKAGATFSHDTLTRPSPGKVRQRRKPTKLAFKTEETKEVLPLSIFDTITTTAPPKIVSDPFSSFLSLSESSNESATNFDLLTDLPPIPNMAVPPVPSLILYEAQFNCPDASVSLDFAKGDVAEFLAVQGEWLEVILKGKRGFVPTIFFKKIEK